MTLWMMATMVLLVACDAAITECGTTLGSESYQKCRFFSALNFTLWWTYHPENVTMDFAYRMQPLEKIGWVAWGINPNLSGMVGTQAILAFMQPSGSLSVLTYSVQKPLIPQKASKISYAVANLNATATSAGVFTVTGSLTLPGNTTEVSHTWQRGQAVIDNEPQSHFLRTDNLMSYGPLNVVSGATGPPGKPGSPFPAVPSGAPSNSPATPATPATNTSTTPSSSAISNGSSLLLFSFSLLLSFAVHHR